VTTDLHDLEPDSDASAPPPVHLRDDPSIAARSSRTARRAVWALFWLGLVLLALGFTMLDQGWLVGAIAPVGPIHHPAAAAVGLTGLALLLIGAEILRRMHRPFGE